MKIMKTIIAAVRLIPNGGWGLEVGEGGEDWSVVGG